LKNLKKQHFALTFCLSFIIAFFALTFAFAGSYIVGKTKPTSNIETEKVNDVFIIDPGHGGFDSGAVGQEGTLEKDINLHISLCLNELFMLSDANAYLTRADDTMLYDENSLRSRKAQDVRNRVAFTQNFVNPVFVSIHQNKFPVSKYSGLQVYYSPNNQNSKILAENIQNIVKEKLQTQNNREVKKSGSSIYVLKNLECPAVLVECGFLSNTQEEKLLSSSDYRKKLALCIFSALIDYEDSKINRKEIT